MLSTVLPALCSAFILNNKKVNALIACKLWGFTCTRSLTMNSNFQYCKALCSIEIISCCCGATVGSEQQHNQDLKEIYKGR